MKRTAKSSFLLPLALLLFGALPAHAEGSRELTANGGDRPFLEFRQPTLTFAGIPFRTTIQVFVQAGETIDLGSSAIGIGPFGDIILRPPNGGSLSCLNDLGGNGFIADRDAENAGPFNAVTNTNADAFTPCTVSAAQTTAGGTGVWEVDFVSPDPSGGGPPNTGNTNVNNDWAPQTAANGFVAAWDVTVRDSSNNPIPGRAFANYLALNMGANGRSAQSEVIVQTRDGYRYRVNLNGLDPAGFLFFSNNKGFQNTEGQPLYRSVQLGPQLEFALPAGVDLQRPNEPDDEIAGDFTYDIFFNNPDSLLQLPTLSLNNITDFRFEGAEADTSGQAGTTPLGGSFKFTPPSPGNAVIQIDANNNGVFTDPEDVEIIEFVSGGIEAEVFWDGIDGTGTPVPPSNVPYQAQLQFTFGEVHFPFIDPENSNGIIIERLNPSLDSTIFFNDDTTTEPGPIDNNEIDSISGTHGFSNDFGDVKGIDRWSFFIPDPLELQGGITIAAADLEITKTHTPEPLVAGGNITYTIVVTNNGPNDVTDVPVTDEIPTVISEVTWTCTISGNGSCGEASGTGNAIATTASLENGASATYTVTGILDTNATGVLTNTATVERPDDVSDPDNDDNDNNNDNNRSETAVDTTTIEAPNPVLGVAKAAGTPIYNGDGTFTIPYTIVVENLGNLPLNDVQITEDLSAVFTGVNSFNVVANSISSPDGLSVNQNFDGQGNNNLLAANNTLAVGDIRTIEFQVTVNPGANFGPYNNTATASGTTPGGTEVTDDSTDGNDADPNGDGTPDENEQTTVTLSPQPLLGVAKAAGTPVNNGDGTFTIPYTIQVENLGNVAIEDLQVVENLTNTFSGVSSFTVVSNSLTSPSGLVVNSNFNGQGNNNLLATGNTLAVGATATISFEVTVTPGTNFGPYNNTATASGTGPDGTPVEDDSTDGNDVDPDGDGTPDEDVPTTVSLLAPPDGRANLRLVKRVTAINDRTFIDIVDDPNLDDNAPSWPGNYLQGRIDVPDVFPGDEVEYTIYFMSDGEVSANNVRICDLVPLNQTFVPNGFNGLAQAGGGFGGVNRGVAIAFGLNAPLSYTNANDGDIARFFTPGNFVPVPPGGAAPQPCPAVNNSANGNGAIVIELGDLPSVADDPQRAFGFIRFRATVD
ncbi:DUF11 domain-containing protein [Oxynema aestuarii]|uniref:DUF11 domain-containing protein n=1 Tax=Oxynema aestuarii AP17 TaxID=2064643 RepID=A0A6H1TWG0_9CYAN|nr:DUF11 domain-containing protein [Oxynema aestuarii]QIZ70487.1 DUF11 domain-containing protein [Oxynema aestuarii AP17]